MSEGGRAALARVLAGLLGVLGVLATPVALYFGGWMLLGTAYGHPGTAALGLLIMVAPPVLSPGGILLTRRLRRRGSPLAVVAAAVPLALLVIGLGLAVRLLLTFRP